MSEWKFCAKDNAVPNIQSRKVTVEEIVGSMLEEFMFRRDVGVACVADHCLVPEEYIEMLLAGEIPKELIEKELVQDLAEYLKVSEDMLRVALGREPKVLFEDFDLVKEVEKHLEIEIKEDVSDGKTEEQIGSDTAKKKGKLPNHDLHFA